MRRIDGTTRLAGVVGHPIAHSLSPAMHNAVYEELGLNWVYLPFDLRDEVGLRRFVAVVPSLPFVGFNVTMPFKREMLELCDEVATTAHMAGAVNTVQVVDGRLVGYNTDGRGLLEALRDEAGFDPTGKQVVVLGAGGAAGAAFVAFLLGRAGSVTIASRTVERGDDLLDRMSAHLGGVTACSVGLHAAEEAVRSADLIVNATSVGMAPDDQPPVPLAWLRPGQVVYDMVYGTPRPTALVAGARSAGIDAFDGLGMLVGQGATAVDIWNDSRELPAPRDVMRSAAEQVLAERNGEVRAG